MLSAGRELNIVGKPTLCLNCDWKGNGGELLRGLVGAAQAGIYVVAYRCPACGSFDLACQAKVLMFPTTHLSDQTNEEHVASDRRPSVLRSRAIKE